MDFLYGVVVLAVVLVIGSYLWIHQKLAGRKRGPKRWPVVGSLPLVLKNWFRLHDFLLQFFESGHGSIWIGGPFGKEGVYIAEPSLVEHVLKTNFANYPKGDPVVKFTRELLGGGIFNADDEAWKLQRKVASYEFSYANLRDYSTVVYKDCALRLVRTVAEFALSNRSMDVQDLILRMTLDSTVILGFGEDLGYLSPSLPTFPFAGAFERANELAFGRFRDPLWPVKRALNIGVEKELKECLKVMDSFSYDVISRRRKDIANTVYSEHLGMARTKPDLLSRFMFSMTWRSEECPDHFFRDIIVNFIIAGRDTIGVTLSWFIYRLCIHPEVLRKVLDEIQSLEQCRDRTIQEEAESASLDVYARFAEMLTLENMGKLHYLHAALSETLRLHPPVPLDARTALANDTLPDGTKIRKGQTVTYCPYIMGRLEWVWKEDAKEFKPERWITNGIFQPESPFKFASFHAGPRACLGKDSAYLQMKLTAAILLRFFKFDLVPDQEVTYRVMFLLAIKNGLKVTASPRDVPRPLPSH